MAIRLQVPHVLYVDPDPEQVQAFSYALLDHADVLAAQNQEGALQLLKKHPEITVIVADLHLGVESGAEFLRRAHDARPGTVNILVTAGFSDPIPLVPALNLGLVWRVYGKTDPEYLDSAKLPQIIADAAKEQARRQVNLMLAVIVCEVVRTIVQRYAKPCDGSVARREHLSQMMAPYLDMSALELALLPVAALVHSFELVVPDSRVRELLGDMPAAVTALRPLARAVEDARERFDGTGLHGKKGVAISALARVIAVVDQFDRLMDEAVNTSISVQQDMLTSTLAALQSDAGCWFDPDALRVFEQMVRENRDAVEGLYWTEAN